MTWLTAALLVVGASEARAADPAKEARATFDRWLEAQNTGTFADYAELYAKGFTGVKRSRSRTMTFDRAGWLADRKRMFQKKVAVEASKVRVLTRAGSALVVFTQRWSSGGYTDVGRKQLVLRRGPRAVGFQDLRGLEDVQGVQDFKIVREELFDSSKATPGAFDLAAFQRFAFVMDGEVVVTDQPDETWASGPAKRDGKQTKDFVVRLSMPVDPRKLPPEIAGLVGTPVRLLDASGVRCEAKIGPLLMRGRMIAAEEFGNDAAETWNATSQFLVAKIDGDRAACAGATWARGAALPLTPPSKAEQAPTALEARAWVAFQRLPESRAIQRRFDAWAASGRGRTKGAWFKARGRRATVRLISAANGPVLISVVASRFEGDDGCDAGEDEQVGGTLWGLWELTGPPDRPTLVLRNQPDESLVLQLTGAVDVEGDGTPELFFEGFQDPETTNAFGQGGDLSHGLLRARDGAYIDVEGPQTPIMICPC